MKSYFEIQIPSMSLASSRGLPPGPAGTDPSAPSSGRVPGPVGAHTWKHSASGIIEETIRGGSITLELDKNDQAWRVKPPAYAHWEHYLPATQGKWERNGDEITICDAANKRIYFSIRQANMMSGRAFYKLSTTGRYELRTAWKRVAKPLPISGEPPMWYGLAIEDNGGLVTGMRGSAAIVLSDDRWFTFFIPATAAGTFRGYSWGAAFVLLTGYIDRGDLIGHTGSAVDHELSLGGHWREQAEPLNQITRLRFEDLIQFALKNKALLHALGRAAVQGTCVDYDEKHVIIGDLLGAAVRSGIYAFAGECVPLSLHSGASLPVGDKAKQGVIQGKR